MRKAGWLALVAAVVAAPALQGCLPVAAVGVGAVAASANDRRTSGTQIEDEGIELRASNRVSERWGDKVHINITSYNRSVLVTGEVPNAEIKAAIEQVVTSVANIRGVTNEVAVAGGAALTSRTNDSYITSKVKARFVDANTFNPFHVKVVTENSTVYLMGIVTEAEAKAATDVARTTGGVRKVVRLFEFCQPTDAVCRRPEPAKADTAKPAAK
jgi:osmotically-inducible protein OsmY